MIDAIEFILREARVPGGRASASATSRATTRSVRSRYDESLCRRNARAYVATEDVVGDHRPVELGVRVRADPDRQPPRGRAARDGQPLEHLHRADANRVCRRTLYPDGVRSYTRVVTHDFVQGAAAAHLAKRLGARREAVVHQQSFGDPYVRGLTDSFLAAARSLGLEAVPFDWPFRRELHGARRVGGGGAAGRRLPRRPDGGERGHARRGSPGGTPAGASSSSRPTRSRRPRSRRGSGRPARGCS